MRPRTLAATLVLSLGCAQRAPRPAPPPVVDPVPMTEAAPRGSDAPATSLAVLGAYERVRALLAADQLAGVADAAMALDRAARAAVAETGTAHFASIAEGASALASAGDLAAARTAFGRISQHVIELLAHDEALARGQHVFQCPMATGYGKWVQPTSQLENPYMGKAMLSCGSESTWQ